MCFCWHFYVVYETLENAYWLIKENFCNPCMYCFVEWWVKPNNISGAIFWFLLLIFGLLKMNFEPTFFQSVFVFRQSVLTSFSTVSLGWNSEFALWCLVRVLINCECKEAYPLAFCKDDKLHFADLVKYLENLLLWD